MRESSSLDPASSDDSTRTHDLRAIVAEGVLGTGAADLRTAGASAPVVAQIAAADAVNRVPAGSAPPASDGELIERIAPRPVLRWTV